MDALKTRVVDYGLCYDRVMDIVYEDSELDEKDNGSSKDETIYDELDPEYASGSSSDIAQENEGENNSDEPIYEELQEVKNKLFNRSMPVVPSFRNEILRGRLEIVRSTGNLGTYGGSKGSLYDKLVRHGGSQQWQSTSHSQQTLLCSSCNKLMTSQSFLNEQTPPHSVRNSQMSDQRQGVQIGSISQFTESYTLANKSRLESVQTFDENSLSDKFQRITLSKSTWTDAERIFLSFYNESMDQLHEIQNEEEVNKVILFGLGLHQEDPVSTFPRVYQKRYRLIKEAIFNICKFSVKIGIVPLVYERRTKKKLLPSYTSLKVLFKLGLKDKNQEFVLVDQEGNIFKDMKEWEKKLKSWKYIVVFPSNAMLTVDRDGEPEFDVTDSTRARCLRSYATKAADVTVGIAGITALGIGAIGVAGLGAPVVLPGLLIGEAVVLTYTGVRVVSSYLKKRKRRERFKDIF